MASIFQIKDSSGQWVDVPIIRGSDYTITEDDYQAIADKVGTETLIPKTEKGVADGVATLDSSGKIPTEQMPEYTATVTTSESHTGTAQTSVTSTIAAETSFDDVVGNLINNDATLKSNISSLNGSTIGLKSAQSGGTETSLFKSLASGSSVDTCVGALLDNDVTLESKISAINMNNVTAPSAPGITGDTSLMLSMSKGVSTSYAINHMLNNDYLLDQSIYDVRDSIDDVDVVKYIGICDTEHSNIKLTFSDSASCIVFAAGTAVARSGAWIIYGTSSSAVVAPLTSSNTQISYTTSNNTVTFTSSTTGNSSVSILYLMNKDNITVSGGQ